MGAPRAYGRADQRVGVQVGGRPRTSELYDLVCSGRVSLDVILGGDSNRDTAALMDRTQDPDRDFTAVGDENLHDGRSSNARAAP